MNANELEREIRSFLEQELLVTFDESITPETDLFKAGVVESRNYLAIIKFLQSSLGVEMTDEDLFMNVLVSLSGILEFAKGSYSHDRYRHRRSKPPIPQCGIHGGFLEPADRRTLRYRRHAGLPS